MAAYKVLAHTIHCKATIARGNITEPSILNQATWLLGCQELSQADEKFINTLSHITDDNDEHMILKEYLGIKVSPSKATSEDDSQM